MFFPSPSVAAEEGKMQSLRDQGRNFPMERKKRILVFGHRNPDTDSIVSAIAYAELKQALGLQIVLPHGAAT